MLPSLLILIVLLWVYVAFGVMPLVAGLFYGIKIKPAVAATVVQVVHPIGTRALRNNAPQGIGRLRGNFCPQQPFPATVAVAGLIGCAGGCVAPDTFKTSGGHGQADKSFGPELIDDDTPGHAKFRWPGLAQVAVVGALLWVVPMALLMAT